LISKDALDKGLIIDSISVLGLDGSVGAVASLELDGKPLIGLSSVNVTTSEHVHLEGEGNGESKTVMVTLRGLSIPVGKNFVMTWKIG
jgi:alpha-D-xyloside xylohydrolase